MKNNFDFEVCYKRDLRLLVKLNVRCDVINFDFDYFVKIEDK